MKPLFITGAVTGLFMGLYLDNLELAIGSVVAGFLVVGLSHP